MPPVGWSWSAPTSDGGDQGSVEQVSAHQRGVGARSRAAPGQRAQAPRPPAPPNAPARPRAFIAPPLVLDGARAAELTTWQRRENAAFRDGIAMAERSAQRPDNGYGDRREDWGAVGRYQMRAPALRQIGWLPRDGVGQLRQDTTTWTRDARVAGVNSAADFLSRPEVQEDAFTAYLIEIEIELDSKRLSSRVGQTVVIGTTRVEITTPGLVAAAHRVGAEGVRQVLAGGRPDLAGPVLTRLRDFGARDAQGSLRYPYVWLRPQTPPATAPRRGTR